MLAASDPFAVVVACALVQGCAPSAPPASAPVAPVAKDGRTQLATAMPVDRSAPLTRKATLHYEIRGRSFPLPVVTGTVAGKPVLMLVDTGANSHVIAGWLARKLSLPMKKLGDVGTDHVGKAIETYRIDNVALTVDEWGPLSATTVLATEVPEAIEKLGIGAFISPQRLDEEGDATIMDLARGELRAAWWDAAESELSGRGVSLVSSERVHACEENDGPVKGLAFVVPATVDAQEVRLLVDTGAQHSDVFSTSTAGKKLAGRSSTNGEPMYTASGKISARTLKSASITTGSVTTTSDVDLIQGAADATCPRDGVLAMDVLRSCTLLFDRSPRSRMSARCARPPSSSK